LICSKIRSAPDAHLLLSVMDLRHLQYFIAVAEAEHFHRAAETLRIAQPALSRSIKALEEDLGTRLFERRPQGTRLTEAGRIFLTDAKRIIRELESARERVRRMSEGRIGTLRIAFGEGAAGHNALTAAIRGFRQREPDVDLVLSPMTSSLQLQAIRHGQVDAGFIYRTPLNEPEFERQQIAVEDLALAMPKSHPLVNKKRIRLKELRDEPLICMSRSLNPTFYDSLMAACLSGGLVPKVLQEASSTIMLCLVQTGMGLGIMSEALRWRLPEGVMLRPVEDLSLPSSLDLVWRRDNTSPALQRFVAQASEIAGTACEAAPHDLQP
jgi:DNA-binding transcriptional LysR family regulator